MNDLSEVLTRVEGFVRHAGGIVRRYHDLPDDIEYKGVDDPVTAADKAVNNYLVDAIADAYPDCGLLAEESKDNLDRLQRDHVWCIDPLDGTKEFIARNGEFSVMVGLAIDGIATLGVVYQPIIDFMYSGIRDQGAWCTTSSERIPLSVSEIANPSNMRLVVSRSHRNPITDTIKMSLGITTERISGSVGLKCGLIARSEADLYLHPAPGHKEWDLCAPEAILVGAGGKMTDCWGRSLRYNKEDVHNHGGLVASNSHAHNRIITLMAPALAKAGIDPMTGW